jgi:probable rRNA maturation factor
LKDHVSHLIIHGLLHLLGFDHEDEAEADEMEDLERHIMKGLGFPDPYYERP